jgi:hypothetical protein
MSPDCESSQRVFSEKNSACKSFLGISSKRLLEGPLCESCQGILPENPDLEAFLILFSEGLVHKLCLRVPGVLN